MYEYKLIFPVAISFFLCLSARAGDITRDLADVAAAHTARIAASVEASGDVAHFFSKNKTIKSIASGELKKLEASDFKKPRVSMPTQSSVLLDFGAQRVAIEFGKISERVLSVNNHQIKIESYKTLLNYENEVAPLFELSRANASFSSLLVESAEADTHLSRWVKYLVAAHITETGELLESIDPDQKRPELTRSIISAYESELAYCLSFSIESESKSPRCDLSTFTCSRENHLAEMKMTAYSLRTGKVERNDWKLVRTSAGYNLTAFDVNLSASRSGDVKAGKLQGQNIFSDAYAGVPFFQYPLVAEKCCADKSGCADKVRSAVNSLQIDSVKVYRAQSPHSVK